jgi:hypothetical protein
MKMRFVKTVGALALLCPQLLARATDLEPWEPRSPAGFSNNLNGVVFGGGQFIAVGARGSVLRSTDGREWTQEGSGTTRDLNHVAYGNGLYVACGASDTLLTSTDGQQWTPRSVGAIDGSLAEWRGLVFAHERFVVAGTKGATATSLLGESWDYYDANTATAGGLADRLRRVASGQGLFVAVGAGYEPYRGVVVSSPEGEVWTARDGKTGAKWIYSVTFGSGVFVAVGESGVLTTSPDGVEWTAGASGTSSSLWGVGHGPAGFVAVGDGGRIRTSPDGVTWSGSSGGTTKALFDVAAGNGTYVIVGRDGTILQSTGGVTPIVLASPIRVGNEYRFQFTADVGQTYQVQSSTDLTAWSTVTNVVATDSLMPVALTPPSAAVRAFRVVKP